MRYGYFDEKNKEFVITRPDTPTPWINYLGSDEYCALFSNTAGGYSFHKDPRDRRITRFRYNNLPLDRPGRYIYLKDKKKGDYWSISWQPVLKDLKNFKYECRHGLGYSKLESSYSGIKTKAIYFVPLKENLEVWIVNIENKSHAKRNLALFTYVEFCMWQALLDMTDFQYMLNIATTECKGSTLYHTTAHYPHLNQKHIAYFSVNKKISSFDTDREKFIGLYRGEANPIAVEKGHCSNSIARGGNPCGSHCFGISLEPGRSKTFVFVLGIAENKKDIQKYVRKYKRCSVAFKELKKLKTYWQNFLSKFIVYTPDKNMNLMLNVWNQYQCLNTFNWSRSASYYESGIGRGMGFRDSNQDTLGVVHSIPDRVKRKLIDLISNQFEDGSCYHQYFPLTKKGDGLGYSDDPLWMVLSATAYLKETGDFNFLSKKIPFVQSRKKDSVYGHLKRAVSYVFKNKGPHGLPLAGFADWNDCLNLGGPKKQGESVMVAQQLCFSAREMAKLAEICGFQKDEKFFKRIFEEVSKAINKVAWDGKWYLRAFNDDKKPVGSSSCKEGRIFLNTQSWAIISGVADKNRATKCMDMVKKYLDTKYGLMLLDPPYTKYDPKIGVMGTFPPGLKENAGIFSHANPWAVIAETIIGRGERAFEYYTKISPPVKNKIADIHKTEGYVYAQFITAKHHPNFGEAKNSWLTGSAAWNLVAATNYILGIRADYKGLLIEPCIPKKWNGFTVKRSFRGSNYLIKVTNPKHVSRGVKEVFVDGKRMKSNTLPIFKDGKTHHVKVIMG
jgi:cellobiose phosphorylase